MPENNDKMSTLSKRLNYAIESLKISRAELARRIGVQQPVIQYLCSSNAKKSKFTYEIAEALEINGHWLAIGEGSMLFDQTTKQTKIPMFSSWQIKASYVNNKILDLHNHDKWIHIDDNSNKESFAYILNDKSMFPRFDIGTIIIINPNRSMVDKHLAAAYIANSNVIVFRQLILEGDSWYLTPINTRLYKTIKLEQSDIILGIVEEARWQESYIGD